MIKKIKTIGLILLLSAGQMLYGQTNKELALAKEREAVELIDNGKLDESIVLLKEAQKLDPDRIGYPYKLASVQYMKKDYNEAIKTLETLLKHKDVTDEIFQMTASSYAMLGNQDKAHKYYDLGLEKFPNSGVLYMSKGIAYENFGKYNEAVSCYEKGIAVSPGFSSNYYYVTLIYCNSTEEVWGMIYGEIFMNLERESTRTAEISKILYDTYKSEIKFSSDTSFSVSFSQNATININDLADPNKISFGLGVYEPTLMLSMLSEKTIDINSLNRIRSTFIDNYFKDGHDKTYPNILFNYQKKIKDAGHIEAYNYWILQKGDEDEFDKWFSENKGKWYDFVFWFKENPLRID